MKHYAHRELCRICGVNPRMGYGFLICAPCFRRKYGPAGIALALLACSGSDFRAAAPRPDAPTRLEERLYDGATPDTGPPAPDASRGPRDDAGGGVNSGGATGAGGSPQGTGGGAPVGPTLCAPETCPTLPCEQAHVPTKPTCCTVATPDKSVCGCRSLTDSICRAQ